jgi:hypothetical protein
LDLQPEREAIEKALNQMKNTSFAGMEYFGSRPETPRELSLAQVVHCNVYIGIFAHRYGSGITEAEYRRALERGIPCLIYFKDDSVPVLPQHIESDGTKAERLRSLKQELGNNHTISNFKTPDQLASRVVVDLHNLFTEREAKPAEYSSEHQLDITDNEDITLGVRAQVVQQSGSPRLSDKTDPNSVRLNQLADNLNQDLALLKEYEDALRYEDDPRRKAKYSREIDVLRTSMEKYQREYAELQSGSRSESVGQFEVVGGQLNEMQAKLDVFHESIKKELDDLRAALLNHYDNNQRSIFTTILKHLNKEQLDATKTVIDAIEELKLSKSEIQDVLILVRSALAEFKKQIASRSAEIPSSQVKELAEILDAPKLDLKSKLKLSAPIIPFILSYESELELKNGVNLEAVWERLLAKARGRPQAKARRLIGVILTSLFITVVVVMVVSKMMGNRKPSPDCTLKTDEFKEEFFNLDGWTVNSGWSLDKKVKNDPTGRLNLKNAPIVGFAKNVCYGNFQMFFNLELLDGESAAWALRIRDSGNYYLFYLSGPTKTFFTYVVQDNKFDPNRPANTVAVIPVLKAQSQYRIEIEAKDNDIKHKITAINTSTDDDGVTRTLDQFTRATLWSSGTIGFRTIGFESFSVDDIVVIPLNN